MNIIKFRIFNPEAKKMLESGGTPTMLSAFFQATARFNTQHKMPYLQFTGLKDCHGKEIYEGDIVRHDAVLYAEVGSVVFCEGACELIHLDGAFLCHLWSDIEERFEVIGNIHEKEGL